MILGSKGFIFLICGGYKIFDNRYLKYTLIGGYVLKSLYRLVNRIKNTESTICIEKWVRLCQLNLNRSSLKM